ncbi:hypothetical protein QBC44DRAFT_232493 [Cladorrhinum sp. PSN332]|nr:hypothetical protein QBC44DRAFT_232493 [Cladorrhinum sp. PSN332]
MPPFQNIAPAPKVSSRAEEGGPSHSPISNMPNLLPKRRDVVRKACIPCRTKKIKCSSGQPCKQCMARDKTADECVYELAPEESLRLDNVRLEKLVSELEKRLADVQSKAVDIAHLSALMPLSRQPYADLLHNDYYGQDSQVINPEMLESSPTQASPGASQLPTVSSPRLDREVMLLPLPQNSLAYELSICYPSVCPAFTSPDAELLGLQVTFEPALLESEIDLTHSMKAPVLDPGMILCDQRLGGLEVSGRWTNIAIDNDLAAELISRYLLTDHPMLGFFDAELFLNDLATNGDNYCSPALVAAILAWACQVYANHYPDIQLQRHADLFHTEAEYLFWHAEGLSNVTYVSTALLLELWANSCGRVDDAEKYKTASLMMSQEMGLIGVPPPVGKDNQNLLRAYTMDSEEVRARSHAAWGLFAYRTAFDLHSGSCSFDGQPLLPLPGRDAYIGPDGLPISLSHPSFADCSFVPDRELAVLLQEVTRRMYGGDDFGPYRQQSFSLEHAEFLFRRFLAWANSLPLDCARGDRNSPATLLTHMRFHSAVIAIFQPFVYGPLQRIRLQTFTTKGSVMCAFNSSIDQLKRLVIAYRRTFERGPRDTICATAGSLFLASGLCQLGPSQQRNDVRERCHYFATCIAGLLHQLPRIPAMKVVIPGLVSVGLSTRTITPKYAKHVMAEVSRRGGETSPLQGNISSLLVVDFELALTDRNGARAPNASARLKDIDIPYSIEAPSEAVSMSGE